MACRPSMLVLVLGALLSAVITTVGPTTAAVAEGVPERADTHPVMVVGNNWEGSATFIDARTFHPVLTLDTIPDREERMAEIQHNPDRLAFLLAIRQFVGEGNDQYTDDVFTSHDGRTAYVSRPSFADVVGIDIATNEIVWRFPMEGYRADHMGYSADGARLLVSDSTANKVHQLDPRTGEKTGEFSSGDSPHENSYTHDGAEVLHASIGRVYTPTDRSELGPVRDASKGDRWFQVVDAHTLEILERWDIGQKLQEAGEPDMSAAVRPMAIHPDGRTVYFQVSFHHGFVEFDYVDGRVLRVADLPVSEEAQDTPREEYLLDSAHHGLALNPEGTRLCVAGTMSDYAAMVDAETFDHTIVSEGTKPYWSTTGPFGDHCWVSYSGDDEVVVLDYASGDELARVAVGDHPQRVRAGALADDLAGGTGVRGGAGSDARSHGGAASAQGLPATGATGGLGALGLLALGAATARRRITPA